VGHGRREGARHQVADFWLHSRSGGKLHARRTDRGRHSGGRTCDASNTSAAETGSLIINPPGTSHSILSENGCIVLAIYEKPVKFLQTQKLNE